MRGSGLRSPTAIDSMNTSKNARKAPVPGSSVIQLLVSAATRRPPARSFRIASSMAGRGTAISATRRIISRASIATSRARQSASNSG